MTHGWTKELEPMKLTKRGNEFERPVSRVVPARFHVVLRAKIPAPAKSLISESSP